jgi:predicted nucleic acid-binding protein
MISVLDVSGAIQIILQKEKHTIFNDKINESSWVIAPDLYVSELTNVLWKYYKVGVITHEESIQFVEDGINLIDDFIDARDLWKEALGEGIRNNHSIYDMYYSVLARRNDALLITNDGPLADICKKLNIAFCYE